MAYQLITGEIIAGHLYEVAGAGTITYNTVTYNTGDRFRGAQGHTAFTSTGSAAVTEVTEFQGFAIEFVPIASDIGNGPDSTKITGSGIEFALSEEEKVVRDVTAINGFSLEFIDFPFFSFAVQETRYKL